MPRRVGGSSTQLPPLSWSLGGSRWNRGKSNFSPCAGELFCTALPAVPGPQFLLVGVWAPVVSPAGSPEHPEIKGAHSRVKYNSNINIKL